MDDQRDAALRRLLGDLGRPVRRALDLGCGDGALPAALGLAGRAIGVDLDSARLAEAPGPVANADGRRLPFPNGVFDLVLAVNVVSSIPDEDDRRAVAAEVVRVLSDDGVVLWYDQRWPNPGNRATRAVTRRDLTRLLPGAASDLAPITVVPALARAFPARYQHLHRLRLVRSHLIGLLRPR